MTPTGPNGGTTSPTPIYGSDVVDLRQWLNQYQFAASKSVTGFQYAAGSVVVVNTFYDGRNLKTAESVPHLLSVTVPGQFASGDWSVAANPAITYTYDAVKRPLTRVQPDTPNPSTYFWSYNGFTTTMTDENTNQKKSTVDALGRQDSVVEFPGNSQYTNGNLTQYGYDVADRLVSVTDAAGNLTTISYDSLSRKTQLVDPNLGTWTYAPPSTPTSSNPLWLVQTQTDYLGQQVSFTYDLLDRVVTKSGTGLSVTYGYDSGTNGIGRRTSMQDAGSSTPATYSYDQRGRLISFTRPITGVTNAYQISMTYDDQDRPLTITYPNNDVLTYVYGDHGLPITLLLNGSPLVNGATYNALLKSKTLPLGNGLTTVYNYFGLDISGPKTNSYYGRLYQIQTGSLQNQTLPASNSSGNYGYDVVGNPTGIAFADHTTEQLNFSYNPIDELMGMSGSASEAYSYAPSTNPTTDVANVITKGATTLSYPGVKTSGAANHAPYAPASAGAVGYSYDANGNRVSDSTYSYTYDVENGLTLLKQGGTTVLENIFDGDGVRLVRYVASTNATTHYVGDWYEYNFAGNSPTVYYPFNGIPIAMKYGSNCTLAYLHHDHLGSLVAASNSSGAEVGSARYMPYGGLRLSTGTLPTDRLFTGQIRDLGDDRFYFFKSRYDDATIGKFHTPDTIVPAGGDPRTLNRYAYALNNPLKFADPSGHDPLDPSGMDPTWEKNFAAAHQGTMPTLQDWRDYQFSATHTGSGPNGAWTSFDWQSYAYVRRYLSPELIAEIGAPNDHAKELAEIGDAAVAQYAADVPWINGPDSTRIYLGGYVPKGEYAWTWGNNIIIGKGAMADLTAGALSLGNYRALIAHEYTHVLQYRRYGYGFFGVYVPSGALGALISGNVGNFGSSLNVLENAAYNVQYVYNHDPNLAAPWELWQ